MVNLITRLNDKIYHLLKYQYHENMIDFGRDILRLTRTNDTYKNMFHILLIAIINKNKIYALDC